jgi:hypothetical protein
MTKITGRLAPLIATSTPAITLHTGAHAYARSSAGASVAPLADLGMTLAHTVERFRGQG